MLVAIKEFTDWRKFKVKDVTVRGYDRELRNLCVHLGNPEIESIELAHITRLLNLMVECGWAMNGLIPKCQAFKKFFEYYRLRGLKVINEDLIPLPAKEFHIPRVITEEEYAKVLSVVPVKTNDPRHIRNRTIINLLWDTGARNGELLSLNVDDLDVVNRQATIRTEKNKGSRPIRQIFWTEGTNEQLLKWLHKRESLKSKIVYEEAEAVFISICSGPTLRSGKRFTIKGVGEMLRRYCNRAGIPYKNAHAYRHHMGHTIIEQTGSNADVMNILGHATLESTKIYTWMVGNELKARWQLFNEPGRPNEIHRGFDQSNTGAVQSTPYAEPVALGQSRESHGVPPKRYSVPKDSQNAKKRQKNRMAVAQIRV